MPELEHFQFNILSKWHGKRKHLVLLNFILVVFVITSSCSSIASFYNTGIDKNASLLFDPGDPGADAITWSPSGEKIAITSFHYSGLGSSVRILDVESMQLQMFADEYNTAKQVVPRAWSPNGKQLTFYATGDPDNAGIWVADIKDKNGYDNAMFISEGYYFAWSRLGELAVQIVVKPGQNIFVYVLDQNTGITRLVYEELGTVITGLSWSPDGSIFVLSVENRTTRAGGNLYRVNIETGETVQLTFDADNLDSVWSPTSGLIAYSKVSWDARPRTYSLHIINSDGSCDIEVPEIGSAQDPTWSPDGTKIAFINNGDIYVVDLVQVFGEEFFSEEFPCNIGD